MSALTLKKRPSSISINLDLLPIVIIFIFLSVFFGLTYEVLHGAHPRPVSAS